MPRATTTDTATAELTVMEEPLRLKIFEADHTLAGEIQKVGQQAVRNLTLNEILREAIHAGLPVIARRYEAMANAAKTTK